MEHLGEFPKVHKTIIIAFSSTALFQIVFFS